MRILVLAPPMEEAGGIQIYTATLVRALGRICGDENVRLVAVPSAAASSSTGTARLTRAAKGRYFLHAYREAASWRPDLCICTHIALAPLGHAIHAVLGTPYWVSAHGIEVWGALSPWRQRALRSAARILAVSAFTRDRVIARQRVSAKRVVIVANAFDENLLTIKPDAAKLIPLGLDTKHAILTVGRLASAERYKGHDVLLHALPAILKRVSSAVYVIAGDGDDRSRLETLARELGVNAAVFFLGRVNRAELAACYNACTIFAMPTRTVLDDVAPRGEGFGIAYLEAMAFGRPVIAALGGAPAEFIRHGETGLLVDPDDPSAVATACVSLLSDPRSAGEMGERGRRLVFEEYSFPALVRRLEPLLQFPMQDIRP